jgi:hypothetical protein
VCTGGWSLSSKSSLSLVFSGEDLDNRHTISFDGNLGIWESGSVKTTLEIDDELYREAKAHASLTGQKMKDLVTEGLRLALQPAARVTGPATAAASRDLAACFAEADKLMKAAPRGPTAREHLNKGRKRLEKP